ncbi:MAG: hypothetical protein IT445_00600 [Phycisphaeraceae bacterium]|nr:hypothetical protein [Phycisphaeraceae bacterium]
MRHWAQAVSVLCVLLTAGAARAIVVHDGTGSTSNPPANESAPANNPIGWANVGWGSFSSPLGSPGTAVYVGNGYVLTANHTSSNSIRLFTDDPSGGTAYGALGGTSTLLTNPNSSDSELRLFRINDPGLSRLYIYDKTVTVGVQAMMIGTGLERGSGYQGYDFIGNPAIDAYGYDWAATRDKTWAYNNVSEINLDYGGINLANTVGSLKPFVSIGTEFDQNGDGQASGMDSGSALFIYDDDDARWELAGIAVFVSAYANQPANTSLLGQNTYYIDLTQYAAQINPLTLQPGDANGDGLVNLADLQILGDNWQSISANWGEADFTGDNIVNLADLQIIGDNWGYGTSPDLSFDQALLNVTFIPEPGAITMLTGLTCYVLLRRRRPV